MKLHSLSHVTNYARRPGTIDSWHSLMFHGVHKLWPRSTDGEGVPNEPLRVRQNVYRVGAVTSPGLSLLLTKPVADTDAFRALPRVRVFHDALFNVRWAVGRFDEPAALKDAHFLDVRDYVDRICHDPSLPEPERYELIAPEVHDAPTGAGGVAVRVVVNVGAYETPRFRLEGIERHGIVRYRTSHVMTQAVYDVLGPHLDPAFYCTHAERV